MVSFYVSCKDLYVILYILGVMLNSEEVRCLYQLIIYWMQQHQSLQGPGFMRGLSHDITFKSKVLELRAALPNIKTSHCCKSEAKMSVKFVRLELCGCHPPTPQPRSYPSWNVKSGCFLKERHFLRIWSFKGNPVFFLFFHGNLVAKTFWHKLY